jgi:hypothetical protein
LNGDDGVTDRAALYEELRPLLRNPKPPDRDGRIWSFCPCHPDGSKHGRRSLSLHPTIGLDCFAGCEFSAILVALGARRDGQRPSDIEATYTYRAEDGTPLFEVCRLPGKRFAQRRPGADTWGIQDIRRVLYRLPEILAADPSEIVFICEGEKDSDRLRSVGLAATTNPGGATKWRPEYNEPLRGRNVAILPDNDPPGHHHAEQVAASLAGIAASVKIIELPGLPEKGDVSDWLDGGHTTDELLSLTASPTPLEDGAALLDEVAGFIRRYVVLTAEEADAVTLWLAHTHAIEAADASPYVSVTSPEKRSGKTRLLEVLDLLAARPWLTGRVTPAVLIRKIDRDRPTLLLDESDAAFKGNQEYAEALRAVLNTGHRRGGVASLCVKSGGDFDLRDFATFCPKAIAGIGRLPDTVADRAIIISLKRRAPTEPIERFRRSLADAEAKPLRASLTAWVAAHLDELRELRPEIPHGLDDRAVDGWEALLAMAHAAGGDWPRRARVAALALSSGDAREDESSGVRLLADIRGIFEQKEVDRFSSVELCRSLNDLEESPWGDWKGKILDPRGLARLLRPFTRADGERIKPDSVRLADGKTPKGYLREWFTDAWGRYLASVCIPVWTATSATSATEGESESTLVADVAAVAPQKDMQEEPSEAGAWKV